MVGQAQDELLATIREMVTQEILPTLRDHGGGIVITGLEKGVLHFRLSGQCADCPSAWLTAEDLVRGPLMARFPGLKNAVADTDADEELVHLAKRFLAEKRIL